MVVPPGPGRRLRREVRAAANGTSVSLSLHDRRHDHALLEGQTLADFAAEAATGAFAFYSSWRLVAGTASHHCHRRNFCELGVNARLAGPGAEAVVRLAASEVAPWVRDSSEGLLLDALEHGLDLRSCGFVYRDCPLEQWNQLVERVRNDTIKMQDLDSFLEDSQA